MVCPLSGTAVLKGSNSSCPKRDSSPLPFYGTGVPFWAQTGIIRSCFSPKRETAVLEGLRGAHTTRMVTFGNTSSGTFHRHFPRAFQFIKSSSCQENLLCSLSEGVCSIYHTSDKSSTVSFFVTAPPLRFCFSHGGARGRFAELDPDATRRLGCPCRTKYFRRDLSIYV